MDQMEEIKIPPYLTLAYDTDVFEKMSPVELNQLRFAEGAAFCCLKCPEKHMIVSAACKTINAFLALFADARGVAKSMQKQISSRMAGSGYALEEFTSLNVQDHPAEGFRYTYDAQGVRMYGEALVIKVRNTYYYLYMYCRANDRREDEWKRLLGDIVIRES